jgi:glycosyltransferase involved in cell wall biosynthesis
VDFFAAIDALIFPTRYNNETEGIVNLEAMRDGLPVISYGRGCIPEIVQPDCGLVIDPTEPFVPAAVAKIKDWMASSESFQAASKAARKRFEVIQIEAQDKWEALVGELCQDARDHGTRLS